MDKTENEDIMHKREALMADGRRKMHFFNFVDATAASAEPKPKAQKNSKVEKKDE